MILHKSVHVYCSKIIDHTTAAVIIINRLPAASNEIRCPLPSRHDPLVALEKRKNMDGYV